VIKLVVDVGLPPAWVEVFAKHGWPAVHWSTVGDPRAKDKVVMAWAREHEHVARSVPKSRSCVNTLARTGRSTTTRFRSDERR